LSFLFFTFCIVSIALLFSSYLIAVQLVILKKVCLWCISSAFISYLIAVIFFFIGQIDISIIFSRFFLT